MAANPQPQVKKRAVKQSAWKALASQYKTVAKLHLRDLFAGDPKRGQRMAVEAVGIYLDYSKNRVTDETLKLLFSLPQKPACAHESTPCSAGRRSTSRKNAPSCTSPCGRQGMPQFWSMERTLCLMSMPCSTGWPTSPIACAVANGKATPENESAMSSISASADPTSGRSWHMRRSSTTANGR